MYTQDVNVGSVASALLVTGTGLVDLRQLGVGSNMTETEEDICQRSAKALGESHVGPSSSFIGASLFCGLELSGDLGDCCGNLVEARGVN